MGRLRIKEKHSLEKLWKDQDLDLIDSVRMSSYTDEIWHDIDAGLAPAVLEKRLSIYKQVEQVCKVDEGGKFGYRFGKVVWERVLVEVNASSKLICSTYM